MKVNREDFLRVLETVRPGIHAKETVEQSTCFIFVDGSVVTYNDEARCVNDSGLGDDVTGAVKHQEVLELLTKMKEKEVEVWSKGSKLFVKGVGRQSSFRLDQEITSRWKVVDKAGKWKPLPFEFCDAVRLVAPCAARKDNDPELLCVHLTPGWMEAMDSVRMIRYTVPTPLSRDYLVRAEVLEQIAKLGVSEFAESVNGTWLHFRNGTLEVACRTWEEEYPDLTPLLDIGKTVRVSLPKGLVHDVDLASIFSESNVVSNDVMVTLEPGKLRLKAEGATGEYKVLRKMQDYKGRELCFLVTPTLLTEVITQNNEVELTDERLRAIGAGWAFISCLGTPEDDEDRPKNHHQSNGRARKEAAAAESG